MQIANGFEWNETIVSTDNIDSPSNETKGKSEKGKFEIN